MGVRLHVEQVHHTLELEFETNGDLSVILWCWSAICDAEVSL
jgi:hypothetical protein